MNKHWALDTLEFNLEDKVLKEAIIKVYNPLPDFGSKNLSDVAYTDIQQLIATKFSGSEVKLSAIETEKIKQQKGGIIMV